MKTSIVIAPVLLWGSVGPQGQTDYRRQINGVIKVPFCPAPCVVPPDAEVIWMPENPVGDMQRKPCTCHYVPIEGGPTSYREHE